VARRFGARAAQYDRHALLQRLTAQQLAGFIEEGGALPSSGLVAEIGCGTGLLSALLAPKAQRYLATDIAPEMLDRCQERLKTLPQAEFRVLNGEDARFSESPALIVSNLTAQWFREPVSGLAHLAAQTSALAFSVPLAGSFPEWEQAFQDQGKESGLLPLPTEAAMKAALCALPGRTAWFRTERHVIRYENAQSFADSFRCIGADTPRQGYRPGPIKAVLKRFAGGMEATALVLYGLIRLERP